MEMSFHSQPHFESEGFWNSEVAYSLPDKAQSQLQAWLHRFSLEFEHGR